MKNKQSTLEIEVVYNGRFHEIVSQTVDNMSYQRGESEDIDIIMIGLEKTVLEIPKGFSAYVSSTLDIPQSGVSGKYNLKGKVILR
ncbi:MAG: hypothetical protein IH845_04580 [Nanoarchaeota archaeon]|nr:hypothetical protein [Nanoarchaeota archaeon]